MLSMYNYLIIEYNNYNGVIQITTHLISIKVNM